jgi:hypothetical protein
MSAIQEGLCSMELVNTQKLILEFGSVRGKSDHSTHNDLKGYRIEHFQKNFTDKFRVVISKGGDQSGDKCLVTLVWMRRKFISQGIGDTDTTDCMLLE